MKVGGVGGVGGGWWRTLKWHAGGEHREDEKNYRDVDGMRLLNPRGGHKPRRSLGGSASHEDDSTPYSDVIGDGSRARGEELWSEESTAGGGHRFILPSQKVQWSRVWEGPHH